MKICFLYALWFVLDSLCFNANCVELNCMPCSLIYITLHFRQHEICIYAFGFCKHHNIVANWILTQIAMFTGLHGTHLGPTGPRWVPCRPCEPCYQEKTRYAQTRCVLIFVSKRNLTSARTQDCLANSDGISQMNLLSFNKYDICVWWNMTTNIINETWYYSSKWYVYFFRYDNN